MSNVVSCRSPDSAVHSPTGSSETAGEVRIEAFDDAGARTGPVTLRLGAGETPPASVK